MHCNHRLVLGTMTYVILGVSGNQSNQSYRHEDVLEKHKSQRWRSKMCRQWLTFLPKTSSCIIFKMHISVYDCNLMHHCVLSFSVTFSLLLVQIVQFGSQLHNNSLIKVDVHHISRFHVGIVIGCRLLSLKNELPVCSQLFWSPRPCLVSKLRDKNTYFT